MKRASADKQMPSLTYMPGRFGQWITYQDNKTIQEMLFSGEAREAYLDSFLSGFALGFPSAGIDTVLLENRGYSGKAADAALDIPAPAVPLGALTDGGLRGVKALSDGKTPDVSTAAADGGARAAEILKNQARTPSAPRAQLNDNVRVQTSVTPQLQADMQASDRAADTVSNSADAQTDIRTDTEAVPVRYEDALRDYLESGLDSAAEPDAGRRPSSGADTLQSAELNSDLVLSQDTVPEVTQETAPKTKEQLISELAPKIQKTGVTPGRATIEAQRLYADAERIFGSNADAVLEMFQPGQDPRKFLDGFRNAYIAGKLGNKAALENSTAAAYLTEEQRGIAFDLGYKKSGRLQLDYANDNGIIAAGSVLDHFDRKIRLSDISEDLKKVNPNYSSREHQWTHNCQRCVATYEMRRRGFNVTAKPILAHESFDTIAKNWSKVWTNDPPLLCRAGNGKAQIEAQMKRWGDGARAIVCVKWKEYDLAHVFVAENRNGTIVYIDPQNGNENCSNYFSRAKEGCTQVLRVDKCTPTDLILECCQNVR